MKASAFFTLAFTASGVIGEPVPAQPPTKVVRDIATVTSVVAQVSAAITKLDTTVKAFDGSDLTSVETEAKALVSALTSGASTLASAGDSLSLTDALGLQDVVTPLGPAAEALVSDVTAKKTQFEKAGLCSIVGSAIQDTGSAAKSLVDNVVAQVPEEAQEVAQQVAGNVVDTLTNLAAEFETDKCKDAGGSASSVAASSSTALAAVESSFAVASGSTSVAETVVASTTAKEVANGNAVTVTVTAPCACSQSSTSSAVVSIATPLAGLNSTVFPTGTGVLSTKPTPTPTSTQLIPTAGAVAHGVSSGSVGLVAALALLFI
ncbi:hydrophobic surface binding protein A-domain-containing protein [Hypoxylon sp. FL0890]|nr:hydrophobic surface binding protein A-domain-containing protein [Hypoxylon sp. FL0890]